MINTALTAVRNYDDIINSGPFSSERLALSGEMILIGMGMIFAVLTILWGVLAMFKFIFAKPAPKKAEAPAPVESAPVIEPEPEADLYASNDDELVAVITAAVAAYMAEENGGEGPVGGFRVVSFRRADQARAWNRK